MAKAKKIGVLLIDDHAVLRGGLRLIIDSQEDMQVLGDTGEGGEAVVLCKRHKPDVILLDLSLHEENGLHVLAELKSCCPDVKVLVLTMHDSEAYFSEVMRLGGSGYILKKVADVELVTAIRTVNRGEIVVDPVLTRKVLNSLYGAKAKTKKSSHTELTPREREVLRLVALGYTNKQVADALVISVKTVESHRYNIKDKLSLNKRSELVRYAIKEGLLEE